jgi:hypothetical protein
VIYAAELLRRARDDHGLDVTYAYTRAAPAGHRRPPGRLDARVARRAPAGPPELEPSCFVCGPTRVRGACGEPARGPGSPAPAGAHRTLRRLAMATVSYVDGNGLAGALREVFAVDLTAAMGTCAGCGSVRAMAETRVYDRARPCLVARCPGCEAVLLRVVRTPERVFLDLRGLSCVELSLGRGVALSWRPNQRRSGEVRCLGFVHHRSLGNRHKCKIVVARERSGDRRRRPDAMRVIASRKTSCLAHIRRTEQSSGRAAGRPTGTPTESEAAMTNRLWFGPLSRSLQTRMIAAFLAIVAVMIGLGVGNTVQQAGLERRARAMVTRGRHPPGRPAVRPGGPRRRGHDQHGEGDGAQPRAGPGHACIPGRHRRPRCSGCATRPPPSSKPTTGGS